MGIFGVKHQIMGGGNALTWKFYSRRASGVDSYVSAVLLLRTQKQHILTKIAYGQIRTKQEIWYF